MPPRPFPFAFRVGTDIIAQSRIHDLITRKVPTNKPATQLDRFLHRTFTPREIDRFWRRFKGFTVDQPRLSTIVSYLAGRWAAKEAAIKAVKPRKLTIRDVEILQNPETYELYAIIADKPYFPPRTPGLDVRRLDLSKIAESSDLDLDDTLDQTSTSDAEAQRKENDENSGQIALISISHDKDYATAVCVAPEEALLRDVGGEAAARMYFD
ncbi:hypothetical protein CERZMDRAFT_104326 [Cercospora zeae-maydis SCOH1-5]|uniref:4'-phosphopantetheinyl transferase domain-containing protein n=1 Tax=Cercospora zeae-maydis SCOH1-5 TaxID=717836 RepID=A0A6A6FWM4_9PEZI|nr:hypothetical protein CERZMDRAFT_104326 [Cercospora zeae-maydis SCOH1-5]